MDEPSMSHEAVPAFDVPPRSGAPGAAGGAVCWSRVAAIALFAGLLCWGAWRTRIVFVGRPLFRALAAMSVRAPVPPRRFLDQGSWSEIHHAFMRAPRAGDPPDLDEVLDVPTDLLTLRARLDAVPHWSTAVLARDGASPGDLARSGLVSAFACLGLGNRPQLAEWRQAQRAPYRSWRLSLLDAGDGLVGEIEFRFLDPDATPRQLECWFEPQSGTPPAPGDWPLAVVWDRPASPAPQ